MILRLPIALAHFSLPARVMACNGSLWVKHGERVISMTSEALVRKWENEFYSSLLSPSGSRALKRIVWVLKWDSRGFRSSSQKCDPTVTQSALNREVQCIAQGETTYSSRVLPARNSTAPPLVTRKAPPFLQYCGTVRGTGNWQYPRRWQTVVIGNS